jgi:hypothetical protein
MNYSTLQEAYNIDTFEKKSKPSQKSNKNSAANGSSLSSSSSNANPSFVETSKLALSSNKVSDYPNNHGSSCSPLQAPNYNIPISNECKKDHDDAMNVYLNATNNNPNMMNTPAMNMNNGINKPPSVSPQQSTQAPTASSASAMNYSTSLFNNIKNSNENVMPYYDEDLEQYFNISNLNDEVKYNSYSYMPNTNKQPYSNNDTSSYANTNNIPKNGNNLLNNSGYNLTPEEKKSAEDAIIFLKSIEDKINNGNINSSGYNKTSILDPTIPPENTGPGGFKTQNNTEMNAKTEKTEMNAKTEKQDKDDKEEKQRKQEKSDTTYIYNAIFNISILLIIGIAIILLCDQIVELAIQIGMKRAVNILEPLIKNQIRAQELANNV